MAKGSENSHTENIKYRLLNNYIYYFQAIKTRLKFQERTRNNKIDITDIKILLYKN